MQQNSDRPEKHQTSGHWYRLGDEKFSVFLVTILSVILACSALVMTVVSTVLTEENASWIDVFPWVSSGSSSVAAYKLISHLFKDVYGGKLQRLRCRVKYLTHVNNELKKNLHKVKHLYAQYVEED